MVKKTRPRAGSLAFYPRKRAFRETASFSSFPNVAVKEGDASRPLNFLAYKAGMTHVLGKDLHEKGVTFGHEVAVAVTVLEAPPLRVFGLRAYGRAKPGFYGVSPLMDVFAESVDKAVLRKMPNFRKPKKRGREDKGKGEKAGEGKQGNEPEKAGSESRHGKELEEAGSGSLADLEKEKEKVLFLRLLCHSQPGKTGIGKKRPEVFEVGLSGNAGQQLAFAKGILGKELRIADVFSGERFVDVRAVTKGKGMQGPVKRFGVKTHRPKAKKTRVVGSIGPWNPSTVMWTVARPGQMGYHSRTEYNKRVLKLGSEKDVGAINQRAGFKNYGVVANDFVVLAGSVAGPAKRAISVRRHIRENPRVKQIVESLDYVAGTGRGAGVLLEEDVKVEHVVEKKEEKKEHKSVADEIAVAAKGGEKREKEKDK